MHTWTPQAECLASSMIFSPVIVRHQRCFKDVLIHWRLTDIFSPAGTIFQTKVSKPKMFEYMDASGLIPRQQAFVFLEGVFKINDFWTQGRLKPSSSPAGTKLSFVSVQNQKYLSSKKYLEDLRRCKIEFRTTFVFYTKLIFWLPEELLTFKKSIFCGQNIFVQIFFENFKAQ